MVTLLLPSWISYLGDKTGHDADRLILEAVDLLNDFSLEVQCAEKYAAVHPGLYLNILENGKHMPADDMVAIGLEAMKAIPKKYVIRSKAALETAEYVIAADEEQSLFPRATSQVAACRHLATAARVKYPAALQRCKFDTPLLAAGSLIGKVLFCRV